MEADVRTLESILQIGKDDFCFPSLAFGSEMKLKTPREQLVHSQPVMQCTFFADSGNVLVDFLFPGVTSNLDFVAL
ncbi:hypothetical protein OS493_017680 [Desmophyllum pertusum]|uniref:Uncharacterized protein n=1 Tax=Desmophyllum pertusum TaxID=174260 RepID=A0A9X0CXI0_9CNID|nr:hypothetical protein OS493_017680 [Desmophyllum pertusum]